MYICMLVVHVRELCLSLCACTQFPASKCVIAHEYTLTKCHTDKMSH